MIGWTVVLLMEIQNTEGIIQWESNNKTMLRAWRWEVGAQEDRNLKFRKQVRAGYRDFRVTNVCVIIRAGTIE